MYVNIDEDTAIDMLVERVEYWTDDSDTIELFNQYYTSMVEGGCYEGCDFDIMSIVDNDYVNNFSIVERDEFEKDREEYIKDMLKSDGFNEEDEDFDIDEYYKALEQYENEVTSWEDLERGENTCEFLSGYCIEAKTSNCLLMS